jgi:adenylate cyclase
MFNYFIQRPKWIVAAAGIIIFWLSQTNWLTSSYYWQKAQGILIDSRYDLGPKDLADPNIKLVGLGTTSFQLDTLSPEEIAASPTLQKMQQPWPWDRSVYAAILEKLMNAGAKVVMFDFVFASETEGDEEFAKALEKYKDHVVVGAMFADEKGSDSKTKRIIGPNQRLLLPGTDSILGLVTLWPDPDDVERRVRYRTSVERETLESLDVDPRIAKILRKQITAGKAPDNLLHITLQTARKFRAKIATPPAGEKIFIQFQGPPGTFRSWPVENMFVDHLWKETEFKGGLAVSNKIVIVGPMAEIFHDTHNTPFGEMAGPEIQAQMLAAVLHGQWLTETSERTNFWLALGCMVLALIICLGIPQALLKGLLLGGATLALLAGGQVAFNYANSVVAMMPPLFCLLATGSFGILFEYALEQIERRRYRHILDRYVSKNVAKVILSDRRSLEESMRGLKKPVTILFSDIRSFTTWTEQSDPDKLVAQLNEYFEEMVDLIQEKNSGTLQKFIGDAIMAAWGDTHSAGIDVDARRAVTAALAMRAALAKLNQSWKDKPDRRTLATGIGVNHGPVVNGNVGAKQRMELTVLGDGVNLAARLESATKQFHTDILIGEEVEKLTRQHFVYRAVDLMTVKGKTRPVEVFGLISDRTVPPPAWLAKYHEAIKLYRTRKFAEAAAQFKAVREEIGGEDFLCEMYLSRCDAYQSSPPPENWDGSFTLSEK